MARLIPKLVVVALLLALARPAWHIGGDVLAVLIPVSAVAVVLALLMGRWRPRRWCWRPGSWAGRRHGGSPATGKTTTRARHP